MPYQISRFGRKKKRGEKRGGGRGREEKGCRNHGKIGTGTDIGKNGRKFMTKLKLQMSGQMSSFLSGSWSI